MPDDTPLIATNAQGQRRLWNGSQWQDIPSLPPGVTQQAQYFQNMEQQGKRPSQADVQNYVQAHPMPTTQNDIELTEQTDPSHSVLGRTSEAITGILGGGATPILLTHPIKAYHNAAEYWRQHPLEMVGREINNVVNTVTAPITNAYSLVTDPVGTIKASAESTNLPQDIRDKNWPGVFGDVLGTGIAMLVLAKGVPAAAQSIERITPGALALKDVEGQPLRQSTKDAVLGGGNAMQKMITNIADSVTPGNDRDIIRGDRLFRRISKARDGTEVNKLIHENSAVTSQLVKKLEPYADAAGYPHLGATVKSWNRVVDRVTPVGTYMWRHRDAYVTGALLGTALGVKWVIGGAILGYGYPAIRRMLGLSELYTHPLRRQGAALLRNALTSGMMQGPRQGPGPQQVGGGGAGKRPPPPWWRPPQTPSPTGPPPGTPLPGQHPPPPWVNPSQIPTGGGPPPGGTPPGGSSAPPISQTAQPPWAGFSGRPPQMGGPPGGSVLSSQGGVSHVAQNLQNFMKSGMTFEQARAALLNLGYKERDIPRTPPSVVQGRMPVPPSSAAPPPWLGATSEPTPTGPAPGTATPAMGTTLGFGTAPEAPIPSQYRPGSWPWPPPQQRLLGPAGAGMEGPPGDPADAMVLDEIHNLLQQNQDPKLAKDIVEHIKGAMDDAQASVEAAQSRPPVEGAPVKPIPSAPKVFTPEQLTAARNLLKKFYGPMADGMLDEIKADPSLMDDVENSSFLQPFTKELNALKKALHGASVREEERTPPIEPEPAKPATDEIEELKDFYRSRGFTEKGITVTINRFKKDPRGLAGAIKNMREIQARGNAS